jgi:glucosamine--fructose-6-phosphate aminotransferase (isomerizing)
MIMNKDWGVDGAPPSQPRLAHDIQGQAASLCRVFQQQCGAGRAELLKAGALVRSAKKTVIVGIGASLNASILLENLLCSHGLDAIAVEAGEFLHYRGNAHRDAAFILVSRSGESVEIVKLLSALRGRGRIIAVTNEPQSVLARAADVVLNVSSLADEMVAIQTYTGTLLTLFLVGMTVVDRLDEARAEVDSLLPEFSRWIATNLSAVLEWDAFFNRDTPVYTLGRGPSCGSAMMGALLFSEIAKAPAIGMAVASFRHGPIEVVDHAFRGLVFAPQGKTRQLNVALAADLVRFGATIRVIGPADAEASWLGWIATPPCSDMLAPLLEIVPIQVAAMRLAQLRHLEVGHFRFARQVARDEANLLAEAASDMAI